MAKIERISKACLVSLLRFYQITVSPLFGYCCRFYPSCSQYTLEAIAGHGILSGLWLSIKRLSRCHPWCEGGVDPIPALLKERSHD